MKKIINDPADCVDEMLDGMVKSHSSSLERLPNTNVIHRKNSSEDGVGLVSGGGSGHEPTHAGFVGEGMLSAAVCGEVFTSPTPDQIYEAIKASDNGQGVFLIIKNYSGDVMNFELAEDLAKSDGIEVDHIVVNDDIAIETEDNKENRRGIAGTIFMHKIMGYYAKNGASVSEMKEMAEKVMPNLKTIGLALTACTVPEQGKPSFDIGDDEFEYGVGIHGEPGYKREKMKPSKEMAEELVSHLRDEFQWQEGDHYAVLVNGLGSTPEMERYIFFNDVDNLLEKDGLRLDFVRVEEWMTSLDMAGISLTMLKLEDQEWLKALKMKVNTLAWNNN